MQLHRIRQYLTERHAQGLYRQELLLQPLGDGQLLFQGEPYLNFSGNDYLGLGGAIQLRQVFSDAAQQYGSASTGSPLITGFHPAHAELSATLCDWLGVESVLLFSSGFAANQAMLSSLVAPDDLLLLDKYSHASMQDLLAHGQLRFKRYGHQNLHALADMLKKAIGHNVVVATEGVFSMDGDITNLPALSSLLNEQQPLLLDDAHGLGVLGPEGRGTWAAQQLPPETFQCLMANFGKALAGQGGFLAGSRDVMDYIRQQARHYVYSTSLAPAMCLAMVESIRLCRTEHWRRDQLQQNIMLFRELACQAGLELTASQSAIQPLLCADNLMALHWSTALRRAGIWLHAIRPPTVPQARLRVSLSAAHRPEQIRQLVTSLTKTRPAVTPVSA